MTGRAFRGLLLALLAFCAGMAVTLLYPEAPRAVVRLAADAGLPVPSLAGETAAAEAPPEPPTVVTLAAAATQDVPRSIRAIGDAVASETVTLTPRVGGLVEAVLFEGGERVEAGALIVQLDPAEIAGELGLAEAELAELQGAFERARQLADEGIGPRAVADDLLRRAQAAQAAVESARARLASFEIRAPFAGRLGLRTISVGALVQPGEAIVRLDAVDPIDVRFAVPERFLADLRPGAAVAATAAAFGGETFAGEVRVVEPQVDPVLRTVRVEARLPNPDGRLVPGKLLALDVTLGVDADAVTVPAVAVRTEGSVQFVLREADGTAERVEVATGQRLADRVVIAEGLAAGERVVVEGLVELSGGERIEAGEARVAADEAAAPAEGS